MYRLATSRARKETSRRKRERFLRHGQPRITYWYSVVVALEWIEFGFLHKIYPVESDCTTSNTSFAVRSAITATAELLS